MTSHVPDIRIRLQRWRRFVEAAEYRRSQRKAVRRADSTELKHLRALNRSGREYDSPYGMNISQLSIPKIAQSNDRIAFEQHLGCLRLRPNVLIGTAQSRRQPRSCRAFAPSSTKGQLATSNAIGVSGVEVRIIGKPCLSGSIKPHSRGGHRVVPIHEAASVRLDAAVRVCLKLRIVFCRCLAPFRQAVRRCRCAERRTCAGRPVWGGGETSGNRGSPTNASCRKPQAAALDP